jgi:hypothetical protein
MAGHEHDPRKTLSLGFYVRSDGQRFEIKALIYELPKAQDSWLVIYDAHHEEWGHNRFTLLIPSYFAGTFPLVETVAKTSALEHVMTRLKSADRNGVDIGYSVSPDGWILIYKRDPLIMESNCKTPRERLPKTLA